MKLFFSFSWAILFFLTVPLFAGDFFVGPWDLDKLEQYKKPAELNIYVVLIRGNQTSKFILSRIGDAMKIGPMVFSIDRNGFPNTQTWDAEKETHEQATNLIASGPMNSTILWMIDTQLRFQEEKELLFPDDDAYIRAWNASWKGYQ